MLNLVHQLSFCLMESDRAALVEKKKNMVVFSFFVCYCFCQYIDDGNEENWQNMLTDINFCQYFMNKPSYYFYHDRLIFCECYRP